MPLNSEKKDKLIVLVNEYSLLDEGKCIYSINNTKFTTRKFGEILSEVNLSVEGNGTLKWTLRIFVQ